MFCTNCGHKLSANDLFCGKCGTRVLETKVVGTHVFTVEQSASWDNSEALRSEQKTQSLQVDATPVSTSDTQSCDNVIHDSDLNDDLQSQSILQTDSEAENDLGNRIDSNCQVDNEVKVSTQAEFSTGIEPKSVHATGEKIESSQNALGNTAKKRGKTGKVLAVIVAVLLLAIVGVAVLWFFGGDKIEVSDEVLAAIVEEGRFDSVVPSVEIVSAKIMGTEEATLFGIDVKDEHVTIKIENENASAKKCFIVSSYKDGGEWHIEYVKENDDPCDHYTGIITAKKELTAEAVEKDIRAYFSDETAECSNIVIPEYNENDEMPVVVTLTVYGDIFGEQMKVDVEAQYYISFIDGWYIGYATYEESQHVDETLPVDTQTDVLETNAPETDAPETNVPETNAPETDAPETDAPETNAPETDAPETEDADNKGSYRGPDQPVSDETVLENLMQDSYENWTDAEIVDSGYNFDGTYTFRCHATVTDKYLPIVPVYLVDKKYVRHDGNYMGDPWYCRTNSYSFYSFKNSNYLLGKWSFTNGSDTYILDVYDITLNERHYGAVDTTVYFSLEYNGETISRQSSGYHTSAGNYLQLRISSAVSINDQDFRLSFNAYEVGGGVTGWYIDDKILLEKVNDPDDEKIDLYDPSDIVGKWAYISGTHGSRGVVVMIYTFYKDGGVSLYCPVYENEKNGRWDVADMGPYSSRDGVFKIDRYNDKPCLILNFEYSVEGHPYIQYLDVKQYIDNHKLVLVEDSMYGTVLNLYYCGLGEIDIYDLAYKQGFELYTE